MSQAVPGVSVLGLPDQSGTVHSCPLFDVVHPALHLSSTFPATFQGPLKNGLGYVVVACHVAKPCQLPPLDCGQQGLLGTSQFCHFGQDELVGLPIRPGDPKQAPVALCLKRLDSPGGLSCHGPGLTTTKQDGEDKGFV